MQKILFFIKITVIVCFICSCSSGKVITGEISHVSGDTVCLPKQCFKLLPNAPRSKVGNKAVFKETKNKNLVNCIKIK